ncbi:acyltransferase [Sphingomonas sp.]|uniref:acyltransferase family protein n=1 Tax=Sphingomonas sp. TaxID=28214 RepID=UPI0025F7B41E|nr:acyltransferase [Sphingomonas sp.]
MNDPEPRADAQRRMAVIDSLRLIAATLVLSQHLFEGRKGLIHALLIPLAPGVAGVAIFFFISGYVIPMAARRGLRIREFMIRRLFRIYPLYLVTLALMTLAGVTQFLPQTSFMADAPLRLWLPNILLIAEYVHVRPFLGVSWTLAIELVWYVLFAMSIVMFGKRAADWLDLLVPGAIMVMALLSLAIGTRIPLGRPTMIYAAVIGFQCYRYHVGTLSARGLIRTIVIFAVVALSGNYIAFGVFKHPNLTMMQAIGPWIVATTVFLLLVLWRPLRDARVLNSGWLPTLGVMSYSIYLLHPMAAAIANRYLPASLQVCSAVLLTLLLSWVGYRFIEKPGIAMGRIASRSPAKAPLKARPA